VKGITYAENQMYASVRLVSYKYIAAYRRDMEFMEEISGTKSHKLILNNRKTGSFTGILDVLSFDVGEILLETELGMLHIKGKDLHVNRLNLEKGEADIEGEVDMITYSKIPDVTAKKDKMFGRIFR